MDKGKIAIQAFLAQVPLFNGMEGAELDRIAAGTTEVRVRRGDTIFRRGDDCEGFHVVVYGQVKLAMASQGGIEKVIELIGPGHSFGEALMFMDKPYIVSAQAVADSFLLHVAKGTVSTELVRDPGFARKMLAGLSRRMHGLMCDLESYCLHSATQRVIGFLLKEEIDDQSHRFTLPVAKSIIASRLNLTPEHFSRIMSELCTRGLIAVSGRDITIVDAEALRLHGA